MPTTLPENVAWSTGANFPVDGEPATIESIQAQIQELKDRSNYLKSDGTVGVTTLQSKTAQLGMQAIAVGQALGTGAISKTVNSTVPADVTNSILDFGSLNANDKLDFRYVQLLVVNADPGSAFIQLQKSEAGGGYVTVSTYQIPGNLTIHLVIQDIITVGTTGDFKLKLSMYNNGGGNTSVSQFESIVSGNIAGASKVFRPMV